MEWVNKFYSESGKWWNAENKLTPRDLQRVELIRRYKPPKQKVFELGSSYGSTSAATAQAGYDIVGIEISDRYDYSKKWTEQSYPGSLKFIKDDFYKVNLGEKFDVVAYWNGFGIGSDDDQRKLLDRMAKDWLEEDGIVLMDVQSPYIWNKWAKEGGDELIADPARGFHHNVKEAIEFDSTTNTVKDTWWDVEHPEDKITQTLRCYTPSELLDLLKGCGLKLDAIIINGEEVTSEVASVLLKDETKDLHEYLVKLSKN